MTACGIAVEGPDGERHYLRAAELRGHVESVLRRQNAVQDRLIFRLVELKGENPEAYDRLALAESQMLDACSGLAAVAGGRGRSTSLGFPQRRSLSDHVAACDRAVIRVEALLAGAPARPRSPGLVRPGDTGPGRGRGATALSGRPGWLVGRAVIARANARPTAANARPARHAPICRYRSGRRSRRAGPRSSSPR